MAKDKTRTEETSEVSDQEVQDGVRSKTTVGDSEFSSPVRTVENVGPVSESEARRINGYEGHDNIASKVVEDQKARGRDQDTKTETGAKYF